MKTKLFLAAVCVLTLPMWFSFSDGTGSASSTPFATVAIAGHTIYGDWCECDGPGCVCDPGERAGRAQPMSNASVQSDQPPQAGSQDARVSELDCGAGGLLIVVAMFMWFRLLS